MPHMEVRTVAFFSALGELVHKKGVDVCEGQCYYLDWLELQ